MKNLLAVCLSVSLLLGLSTASRAQYLFTYVTALNGGAAGNGLQLKGTFAPATDYLSLFSNTSDVSNHEAGGVGSDINLTRPLDGFQLTSFQNAGLNSLAAIDQNQTFNIRIKDTGSGLTGSISLPVSITSFWNEGNAATFLSFGAFSPASVTIGNVLYTASFPLYTTPGAPPSAGNGGGSGQTGNITVHISARDAIAPAPSSLLTMLLITAVPVTGLMVRRYRLRLGPSLQV